MPDRTVIYPRMTLARAIYGFVLLGVVAVGLIGAVILNTRASTLVDESLDRAVRLRTEAAGMTLARSLHADWRDLKFLVGKVADSDAEVITGLMDGMRGDGQRISWIGYADINGEVLQASDDLLVGQDVSERPWFRNGLRGAYAGDVHEAVLLAKLIASNQPGGLRFVDLAMPVKRADGQVIGVVGVHINFAWAENFLKEQAAALAVNLYLSGPDGQIIVTTAPTVPTEQEVRILRAAQPASEAATREVWPDGKTYFSSLVPQVGYQDLPSFGWRLIGRLDGDNYSGGLVWLRATWIIGLVAMLAVIGGLTAVFVLAFIRPFEKLGNAAEQIAAGQDVYPPDERRTREMAQLSAALARLETDQID
ncbi:hypothetical protein GCM10007928_06160 [Sulfitobacter porphyrae]|nr:hypothetical protein GCM10007928_06160 [Sulfitobacter porphyrae]